MGHPQISIYYLERHHASFRATVSKQNIQNNVLAIVDSLS